MKQIFLHEPYFHSDEIKNLKKCIKSGWVSTGGKFVKDFEKKISNFTNTKYSVALNSGTSSLDLSLKALKPDIDDEVIVPTITFIAPVNSIIYNLCKPIFMDVDNYGNLDVNKVIEFLKNQTVKKKNYSINKKTKKRIRAIIIIHVFGNVADVIKLKSICKIKNISIIEDASESLGSYYKVKNKLLHSGSIGDVGCISYNANKIITTGSGGSIITNSKSISRQIDYLATQAKNDPIKFIHNEIGYNMKLNNLSASIGISQMKSISKILKKKKKIFNYYKNKINLLNSFEILDPPSYSISNYWIVLLKIKNKKMSKDHIFKKFFEKDIQVRPVWYPNHLQKKMIKFQRYKLENYKNFFKNIICLPSGYNLNTKALDRVIRVLNQLDKNEKS